MKMQRNKSLLVVLVLLPFLFMACSGTIMGKETKSFSEMTTKEKATVLMSTYSKQYDQYMVAWNKPGRTEAENEMLAQKRKALTELYPYINTFAEYADSQTIPPAVVEQAALQALNRLLNL
jgi:hypothetical protein